MIIKPAYKDNTFISKGRGSGGLVIMWKKYLTKYVTNITSENFRIQAVKVNFPEAEIVLVNLYFMVDTQNNNDDDNELLNLLAELTRIIDESDCSNLLLAGDFNCDFARNTNFVNTVKNFVNEKNLNVFWEKPDNSPDHVISNVEYTYSNIHSSTLDHFIGSDRVYNNVIEANVINSADNLSGHLPIYTKFIVNNLNIEVEKENIVPKPSWQKATYVQRDEYKVNLDERLLNILSAISHLGVSEL